MRRITDIVEVHAEIDRQTALFESRTGVHCPDGCGKCCLSPEIETTVADLVPMAAEILERGLGAALLERLDARHDDPRCVLYEPESSDDPARGRCSMYAWRPSVCRLFGFAGRRDADSRPQFVACRVHAHVMPDVVAATHAQVESGAVELPIYTDLAGQVTAMGPASRPQPINAALREAIDAAALSARLGSIET